jgi:hypothetical protein
VHAQIAWVGQKQDTSQNGTLLRRAVGERKDRDEAEAFQARRFITGCRRDSRLSRQERSAISTLRAAAQGMIEHATARVHADSTQMPPIGALGKVLDGVRDDARRATAVTTDPVAA